MVVCCTCVTMSAIHGASSISALLIRLKPNVRSKPYRAIPSFRNHSPPPYLFSWEAQVNVCCGLCLFLVSCFFFVAETFRWHVILGIWEDNMMETSLECNHLLHVTCGRSFGVRFFDIFSNVSCAGDDFQTPRSQVCCFLIFQTGYRSCLDRTHLWAKLVTTGIVGCMRDSHLAGWLLNCVVCLQAVVP